MQIYRITDQFEGKFGCQQDPVGGQCRVSEVLCVCVCVCMCVYVYVRSYVLGHVCRCVCLLV
jgi:hypothetical protein